MNVERSIDPTADQVRALRDDPSEGPIVMVNLLKFRDEARYPPESAFGSCNGREAYARYQQAFSVDLNDVSEA
ncbi:MAG: hypothetical protein RLN70_06785, partial [Rhodospirillaceae bacterium]